jgi:hypothetical protein
MAASNDHLQVVEVLRKANEMEEKANDMEEKPKRDIALLLRASGEGDVATVRVLLESGSVDVNDRDEVRLLCSRGCERSGLMLRRRTHFRVCA